MLFHRSGGWVARYKSGSGHWWWPCCMCGAGICPRVCSCTFWTMLMHSCCYRYLRRTCRS